MASHPVPESPHLPRAGRLPAVLTGLSSGLFAGTAAIAVLTLCGWAADWPTLKSLWPGAVAMNPLSAVLFLLAAAAAPLAHSQNRPPKILGVAFAGVVCLCAASRAAAYAVPQLNLRLDEILMNDRLDGNVMAPNTAILFLMCGTYLASVVVWPRAARWVRHLIEAVVLPLSVIALLGYGYGIRGFYNVGLFIAMAPNTALCFCGLSLGLLLRRPDAGIFLPVLTSPLGGGIAARRLLPAAVMVPVLLGALHVLVRKYDLLDVQTDAALFVVLAIMVFQWAIAFTAGAVNRAETGRLSAESEMRRVNENLEVLIEERTRALREAQKVLVQHERLRALGEMASGIAHDFNNALSPILGYTDLMLDPKDEILNDREETLSLIKMVNTSAKDAAKVVSRLREFYRPRESNESFQLVDLRKIVEQAVTMTQPKWKTQAMSRGLAIDVETRLDPVPSLEGNEVELREALTNLIFNAVDAMPRGGLIEISTRSAQGRIELEVRDTGTGMSEEVRRRCFEPFYTTKKDSGTGLGLSMVYGIIQRHGGSVELQSRLGIGTTFIIRLPEADPARRAGAAPAERAAVRPLKILLVDDQAAVRDVIERYLKRDGHAVETASNGFEAMRKFYAGRFDLVIMDRAMPEMTGDQLAKKIKQAAPGKPVLMVSGTADLQRSGDDTPEGVDALLNKPVTLDELRAAIAKMAPG